MSDELHRPGVTNFGYPSSEPCVVCHGYDDNQSEPRFHYTVCRRHQEVPPAFIAHLCTFVNYHGGDPFDVNPEVAKKCREEFLEMFPALRKYFGE